MYFPGSTWIGFLSLEKTYFYLLEYEKVKVFVIEDLEVAVV